MPSDKDFHVAVSIVTWNGEEYIGGLLESLKKQTFKDFHIIIVDNASKDKTLEIMRGYDNVACIKNSANLGFSRGYNKGIDLAMKFWQDKDLNDRFIFVCNQDIVLAEDCLEKIILSICQKPRIGSAGPRLLRLENEEPDNLINTTKTGIVDSLGLEFLKSRRAIDKFSGMEYDGPLEAEEVFGVSGALVCFRAAALSAVKWGKEYFDEDFFAYKEDVDIAWRLRNLDWSNIIVPSAVAYHHRGVKGNLNLSILGRLKSQKQKPQIIKFLSLRNHLWMIYKNDFFINHLLDWPFIFSAEFVKFFYYLMLDTKSVRAYFSALRGLPKILSKRAYLKNAKAQPGEIRKWFK